MTATLAAPPLPPTPSAAPPSPDAPRRAIRRVRKEPAYGVRGISVAIAVAIASLSLVPVYREGDWIPPVLAAILAVSFAGGVARWLRAPLPVIPVIQGFVLLCAMVRMYAPKHAWGTWWPGPKALDDLRLVMQDGLTAINQLAPPVPSRPALVALTVISIGFVTIVADSLTVSVRAGFVAGFALLGIYVVPVMVVPGGASWWAFLPAAIGFAILAVVDQRTTLLAWGPVLGRRRAIDEDADHTPGLVMTGARLGLLAMLIAAVIPQLVPSLSEVGLGRGGVASGTGPGGGEGSGDGLLRLNPFVSLKRDLVQGADTPVLDYRTTNGTGTYLRLLSLPLWDGSRWAAGDLPVDDGHRVANGLPLPNGMSSTTGWGSYGIDVNVSKLANPYLPLPYPVTSVTAGGTDFYYDDGTRSIYRDGGDVGEVAVSASALEVTPTPSQLREVIAAVPVEQGRTALSNVPAPVAVLARQVTADARTDYDKMIALERFFTDGEFRYDTNVRSIPGGDFLSTFLADKAGYCEQFAGAFAVMAGSLGLPSRVAIGFTAGDKQPAGGFSVTTHDTHSWPEVFFGQYGWIRFEPTPRAGAGVSAAPWSGPRAVVNDPATGPSVSPTAGTSGSENGGRPGGRPLPQDPNGTGGAVDDVTASSPSGVAAAAATGRRLVTPLVLLLVLLAALTPASIRWWRRRQRLAGATPGGIVEGAWAELRDTVRDAGRVWTESETPRQAGARVVRDRAADPQVTAAVGRLVTATERSRFAATPGRSDTLAEDVTLVRESYGQTQSRLERFRSFWLPRSVMQRR